MMEWRKNRDSRELHDKPQLGPSCSIDKRCPQGYVCVDGTCIPLGFLGGISQMSVKQVDENRLWR